MGQLEHLGPQIRSGRHQGCLGSGLDVAGQQDAASPTSTRTTREAWLRDSPLDRDGQSGVTRRSREALGTIPPALLGDLDLALLCFGEETREGGIFPPPCREPQPRRGDALEHRAQSSAVVEIP